MTLGPFHVASRAAGDTVVVEVTGELDMFTAPELREELSAVATGAHEQIAIDLREVPFIDSSGLSAIFFATRTARLSAKSVVVIADGDVVRRPFATTAIDEVVPILSTPEWESRSTVPA